MSGQTTDAAEFLEAWSQVMPTQIFHPVEVFHFSCAASPNVLSPLALLDSVRKGFFHAVIMTRAPGRRETTSTPHSSLPLPELHAEAVSKTQCSNRQLEVTSWICEQAAHCRNRRVAILLTFSHGPASPWALKDFRSLQQHAGEVHRRALGYWSNFRGLQQEGYAPLHRSCPCATQHVPVRGKASGQEFNSTHQQTLGVKFWSRTLRDASPTEPIPFRDGSISQLVSVGAVLVIVVPRQVFGHAHTSAPQRVRRPTKQLSSSRKHRVPHLQALPGRIHAGFTWRRSSRRSSGGRFAARFLRYDACRSGILTWLRRATLESAKGGSASSFSGRGEMVVVWAWLLALVSFPWLLDVGPPGRVTFWAVFSFRCLLSPLSLARANTAR